MPGWVHFPEVIPFRDPSWKGSGSMDVPVKTERSVWRKVKAHCERRYHDKDETTLMQEARIREQRQKGDNLKAWTWKKVEGDCLVTGMLQELPMESVCDITHWFEQRFLGEE